MQQMGYPNWQDFERVIERAKTAAHNQGFNVQILFRIDPKKTGGRPQTDYLLTRFAMVRHLDDDEKLLLNTGVLEHPY